MNSEHSMHNKFSIMSLVAAAIICVAKVSAQAPQPPTGEDRQRMLSEVRNYKHDLMTKELELTKEQQHEFFALYDEMEDRINKLNSETRELEQRVSSENGLSEVEMEAAAKAIFGQKSEEGKIELEYFELFKTILNPKQLLRIKNTERKFTQQLVQHHRRLRAQDGMRKKQ